MDALATMQKRKNQEPFDLVFMDADKRAYRKCVLKERIGSKKWSYIFKLIYNTRALYELVCVCRYYDLLLGSSLLAPGALILCDNVLFKGMVLNSTPVGKAKLQQGKKLNYWQRRHQVNGVFV